MKNKKLYYGILLIILCFALLFNASAKVHHSKIATMYIRIAEKFTDAKMYDISNFYYESAKKICGNRTTWVDYNIAKNIVNSVWGQPVTPYKKAKLEKAIKHLDMDRAKYKYPDNADINAQYAYAYEQMNECDKAIEYYKKALEKVPHWGYGWFKLGFLYTHTKLDYKKGLEYIERAFSENYYDKEAYFQKAFILSELERYEEAIVYYNKYLSFNRTSVAALVNITGCEIKIKDFENAKKHLELGLRYNRHSAYLISHKIDILMHEHKFDEAMELCNDMVNRSEHNGYIAYWALAEIYRYKKDYKTAEEYYLRARLNAQHYYTKYCDKSYDLNDMDGFCSNRYKFIQDFEKEKAKPIEF